MTPKVFDRGKPALPVHHKIGQAADRFDRCLVLSLCRQGTGFETHGRPFS